MSFDNWKNVEWQTNLAADSYGLKAGAKLKFFDDSGTQKKVQGDDADWVTGCSFEVNGSVEDLKGEYGGTKFVIRMEGGKLTCKMPCPMHVYSGTSTLWTAEEGGTHPYDGGPHKKPRHPKRPRHQKKPRHRQEPRHHQTPPQVSV